MNFKFDRKKAAAFLTLCIATVAFFFIIKSESEALGRAAMPTPNPDFSPCEYLKEFGITVDESEIVCDEIRIPYEFNEVFTDYNNIQRSQGFDLEKFKGITLTRYTAPFEDYPDSTQNAYVELLTYEGNVVAADVYSTNLEGFIKALK